MNHVSRHVLLTPAEKMNLKRACHNRLNWSDGGHWIGVGKEPNCFAKTHLNSNLTHTYRFPTDQSANKWNAEWEQQIRYLGHIGTVGLTIGVGFMSGGWGVVAASTFLAIIKDEIQAKITYPRVARGWSCQVTMKHEYQWSPHPMITKKFTISTGLIIRDHAKKIIKEKTIIEHYSLDDLPEGMAEGLASQPNQTTSSDYF